MVDSFVSKKKKFQKIQKSIAFTIACPKMQKAILAALNVRVK
jgi:hypothetical protein